MYELRYHGPEPTDYHVYRLYPNGRRQRVSEQQDLYQAWLADGNSPEVIPYTPPAAPTPITIPEERQAVYARLLTLWAQTGLPGLPETFDAAIAAIKPWVGDASDLPTYIARAEIKDELLARRMQMMDHGWPWDEFLRYVAEVSAP